MSNVGEDNQKAIAEFILDNLPRHTEFALGTTDGLGNPWIVCVGLTFDSELKIVWKSEVGTEHSKHIAKNPNVAICVFSKTQERGEFGFYAKAIAREVSDLAELAACLDVRYAKKGRKVPPMSECMGDSPFRIYCADITEAWVVDDRHLKTRIDLAVLRDAAKRK